MRFKVAVIGAGYFGQRHIKMLTQMPDVEVVGVVDKEIEKAKEVAQHYGLKYFNDYRELLKCADIFFVVTPTITHFDIAMQLIKEGKSLFVEKPLTGKPAFAEKILEEAMKRNIVIQAGLIERYNPVIRSLLEYFENPLFIYAERVSPFSERATDTDVTYDLMIHDIDLVWMMLKKSGDLKIKKLQSFTKSIITSRIDYATVWMEFVNNSKLKINLTASRLSSQINRRIVIVQNHSVLHADLISRTLIEIDKKGRINELPVKNKDAQPLYEEIRDFLNSVKEGKLSEHAPTSQEIIKVIELIDKINKGDS